TTLTTTRVLGTNEAFLWSNNSSGNTLVVSAAGTYSLRIRNTVTGCTSAVSNIIVVSEITSPATPTISGTTSISAGGSTTLTSSSATGNVWSTGETTQSITTSTPGIYTLRVVNATCNLSSAETTVTITRPFNNYTVSTLAGNGTAGFVDAIGENARFRNVNGINIDSEGSLYATDVANHSIRKISPLGVVTTLAGTSGTFGYVDGSGAAVRFNSPHSVAIDPAGNVYVADQGNHCIRKITPSGVVSTFAGTNVAGNATGTASNARFNAPSGIVINSLGEIFVADLNNNRIRKISADGTTVTTFAGSGSAGGTNGTGTAASFNGPSSLSLDGNGNLYVGEITGHRIRKITPAGVVTTLAGTGTSGGQNGIGNQATFANPGGITVDKGGNVYVVEFGGHRVRKITADGFVSTIGGDGTAGFVNGNGSETRFNAPQGIVVDGNNNLFVAARNNNSIRKMVYCDSEITTPIISGGSTICSGSSTVLTSSSATGNVWSNGATTQSITVSSAGSYFVTVFNGACASLKSNTINVAVTLQPTFANFGSSATSINSSLVINGTNLTGTTSVRFGETPARFTVNSNTQITATVPRVANTGKVSLSNASGCSAHSTSLTVTRQSSSNVFGTITTTFNSIVIGSNCLPAITDLDGDGLLDLLIAEAPGNLNHYEQTAVNGLSFSLVTDNFNGINIGLYGSPAFTDLDGDGLLDMLIGEQDGNLNHYEQNTANSTSFTLVTANFNGIDVGSNSTPAFTDLDGDGLLDMLIGEFDGNLNHFEQNA
ncbi:MAG: FG-GAP-like repeat-containing protein, partial [Flexibacteraceae bacterium]